MTWEDFKEANGADIKQEVDEDFYRMVPPLESVPGYPSTPLVDSELKVSLCSTIP